METLQVLTLLLLTSRRPTDTQPLIFDLLYEWMIVILMAMTMTMSWHPTIVNNITIVHSSKDFASEQH